MFNKKVLYLKPTLFLFWQQKSREILFAYLVYIKEELDKQPDLVDIGELKKHAVVLTNRGPRNPVSHPVHFSTAFGNQIDLPKILPGNFYVQTLHEIS